MLTKTHGSMKVMWGFVALEFMGHMGYFNNNNNFKNVLISKT